jgi:DNA-binding response OmpR family regulator
MLMTARFARLQQIDAVLESGMNAVITKPYNLQELLRVVQPPDRVMDSLVGDSLTPTASVPAA